MPSSPVDKSLSSPQQTTEPDTTARATYRYVTSAPPPNNHKFQTAVKITSDQTIVSKDKKSNRPYMLALHTAEQLTSSISYFIEFLNMVQQWNLTGVEPVVHKSRIFALRSMHPDDIDISIHYHQLLNQGAHSEQNPQR